MACEIFAKYRLKLGGSVCPGARGVANWRGGSVRGQVRFDADPAPSSAREPSAGKYEPRISITKSFVFAGDGG